VPCSNANWSGRPAHTASNLMPSSTKSGLVLSSGVKFLGFRNRPDQPQGLAFVFFLPRQYVCSRTRFACSCTRCTSPDVSRIPMSDPSSKQTSINAS